MKAQILLAATLSDWEESNDILHEAEAMWRVYRRRHPEGKKPGFDAAMEDHRESLDEVRAELERTYPYDSDSEDDVEYDVMARVKDAPASTVTAHEEHVKDVTASMRSLAMVEPSAASSDDEMVDAPAEGADETDAETHQDQACAG